MGSPGRRVRVHLAPRTMEPFQPLSIVHYLSTEPLPGFRELDALGTPMHAYRQLAEGPRHRTLYTTTSGTRTDTIGVNPDAGGIVNSWTTADTGYSVDWVNRWGATGRGLSAAAFIVDGTERWNPTLGGNVYEGPSGPPLAPWNWADGYSLATDLMSGSPIVETAEVDLGGGSRQYHTIVAPLDWDPFGFGPEGGPTPKGGSAHDPVVYDEMRLLFKVLTNWTGNLGVHQMRSDFTFPSAIPTQYALQLSFAADYHVFGFDEIYAYSANGATYTRLDGVEIYAAMSSPAITSVTGASDTVTIVFTSSHGRETSTRHKITMTGWSGSPDCNGTFLATFTDSTTATYPLSGASGTYTGGSLSSPSIKYADFSDVQSRSCMSDLIVINAGSFLATDQEGFYPNKSPFVAGGRHAFIHRALASGGNSWSLNKDFAVAAYCRGLGASSQQAAREELLWTSARSGATPTNANEASETLVEAFFVTWSTARPDPVAPGTYGDHIYKIVGTYAQVQSAIATLDGMSDAQLSW